MAAQCLQMQQLECRKQGLYDCEHDRKFSDKNVQWGWNNKEKDHRFWQLVCADNKHDLPIYINIDPANKHEAYMAIRGIDRFCKQAQLLEVKRK